MHMFTAAPQPEIIDTIVTYRIMIPLTEDDKLRQDLEKVEQLESKIKTELSDLQSKIDQMTNDLSTYTNTEAQRREAEELKQVDYDLRLWFEFKSEHMLKMHCRRCVLCHHF